MKVDFGYIRINWDQKYIFTKLFEKMCRFELKSNPNLYLLL